MVTTDEAAHVVPFDYNLEKYMSTLFIHTIHYKLTTKKLKREIYILNLFCTADAVYGDLS